MNGIKHSFFSKVLCFETEEEEKEYQELLEGLRTSMKPLGMMEKLEVDEIATQRWFLRKCQELIQQRLEAYEKPQMNAQLARFIDKSSLPDVPIPGLDSDAGSPWEVREFVATVTNDTNKGEQKITGALELNDGSERSTEGNRFHVQIKLGQSLDTLLRYEGTIQKRIDRSLDRLLKVQEMRKNAEVGKSVG